MIYHCCDQLRRNAVGAHATLNGIDYLEVVDKDAPAFALRQRTLLLRLLKAVPGTLGKDQLHIDGGERVRDIERATARLIAALGDAQSDEVRKLVHALKGVAHQMEAVCL